MVYQFMLSISYHEYARYYQGAASCLSVIDTKGLRLQLPAARFRTFLTQSGLHGCFQIRTENGRLIDIKKLS